MLSPQCPVHTHLLTQAAMHKRIQDKPRLPGPHSISVVGLVHSCFVCREEEHSSPKNVLAEFIYRIEFFFTSCTNPRQTFGCQAVSWRECLPCCELCLQSLSSCCLCLRVLWRKNCCQAGRKENLNRM